MSEWKKDQDDDRPMYTISVIAEMLDIHPQTLRLYEREGLLLPSRSEGNTRLFSKNDIKRIELIKRLTREMGVNLAGVEIIINMRRKISKLNEDFKILAEILKEEIKISKQCTEDDACSHIKEILTRLSVDLDVFEE